MSKDYRVEIKYLKHHQIDKQKWDSAIENAANGLVYALSWYLDIVSPGWCALVVSDYEMLMPLTIKRKYGIRYIIQPPFSQQLGIFSRNNKEINPEEFFQRIPSNFKIIHIHLNSGISPIHKMNKRLNYELNLIGKYENIRNRFNNNTLRNINKAEKNELKIETGISASDVWAFKKTNPVNNLSHWHYNKLLELMKTADNKSIGESYGVFNETNQLIAAAYLVLFKNRITLLVSSSNLEGKEKSAMFFVINEMIRKYETKNYILDFEGGNISGMARFFSGFGADPVNYYTYQENRFFWPLNKLM